MSRKKSTGLILIEALGAVSILIVGTIATASAVQDSTESLQSSRDYLIAEGLAGEAVEAIKNLRSTNLLLKPDDTSCWLSVDLASNLDSACTAIRVDPAFNYIPINEASGWTLEKVGNTPLDLKAYGSQTDYQLYFDNGRYENGTTGAATKFYRGIKFISVDDEKASFEANLQWLDGKKAIKIKRLVNMFNYQQ